jgi:hypothetical protein
MTLAVIHANLATSVEEATNHFAVGVAFITTRFFFVQFKSCNSQKSLSRKQQLDMSMVMRFRFGVALMLLHNHQEFDALSLIWRTQMEIIPEDYVPES